MSINNILFCLGVLIIFVLILIYKSLDKKRKNNKSPEKYQYKRKDFFLSRAEHACYDALIDAVGSDYYIFSQVHLPTIVDNKIVGQYWRGAFRHIDENSVDFVLCDKKYISPKLVIELDDQTHERLDRQKRDKEVERILQEAGLPLLRLENHGKFNPSELLEKINAILI